MAGELSKHAAPARAPMAPPVSESLGFAPLSESGIGGAPRVCVEWARETILKWWSWSDAHKKSMCRLQKTSVH